MRISRRCAQYDFQQEKSASDFHRISLRISAGTQVTELSFQAIEKLPQSYRIIGMNEAVVFVIPFTGLRKLDIEKGENPNEIQTRSLDLTTDGVFASVRHAVEGGRPSQSIEREVVRIHSPITVFQP